MKILFFSYAYPNPLNPGLGTFNRTMIAGLSHDHELRVVSPVPFTDVWKASLQGRLPRGLNDPSFQAVPKVKAEYCPWYYTPRYFRPYYGHFMRWSVRSTLDRALREFNPDIVLSYWTHPDGEVAVATAHQHGIPAVQMVGGSDVLIYGRHTSRRTGILRVLQRAEAVVTVSDDIKRVLVDDGLPEHKLHVVRRGIDRQVYHNGDHLTARQNLGLPVDQPLFVNVGRLVQVKGHTHLIEACRILAERGTRFRGYILGDGPLRSELQRQIDASHLSNHLQLCGAQTSGQLAEWYRAADVSVLASLSEGVPNVLLESIACGTPFVATNVGGIPEIADTSFDRLVTPANPAEMADAISDRLLRASLPRDSRRRFEPLSMSESAACLSTILQDVRDQYRNARQTSTTSRNWAMPTAHISGRSPEQPCDAVGTYPGRDESPAITDTDDCRGVLDVASTRTAEFSQAQSGKLLEFQSQH